MAKQKTEPASDKKRFRVTLNAQTPLKEKQLELEAESSDDAWRQFCDFNGISGSTCEREIVEV